MGNPLERRTRILDAAQRLFDHYGPAKTTIGDIARAAGIGVGSVYLEFCSKEAIVRELARRRHGRVLDAMRVAARKGSPPERLGAALEARVRAYFQLAEQGTHACDLRLCAVESQAAEESSQVGFQGEERELLLGLLSEGMASGVFRRSDPERLVELLERAYASFSPPWLFQQAPESALAAVRELNRLVLGGLQSR